MRPCLAEREAIAEGVLDVLHMTPVSGSGVNRVAGFHFVGAPAEIPVERAYEEDDDDDWEDDDYDWEDDYGREFDRDLWDDLYDDEDVFFGDDCWDDDYFYDDGSDYDYFYDIYPISWAMSESESEPLYESAQHVAPEGCVFWKVAGFDGWWCGTVQDVVRMLMDGVYTVEDHDTRLPVEEDYLLWADLD